MSDGYILQCGHSTVAVDYWTAPHAAAFFLTHLHADHYKGLHNDWCLGTIYCSELTSLLLFRKWPRLRAKVVPVDEPVVLHLPKDEPLAVTAIAANHCPGAVMFLFEGRCGRVLHTGDFRWEQGVQADLLQHPALTAGPLDLLVLDNTYCHPRYDFPSRLEACQSIISLIQQHPDMDIVLGIDSLGKEDMLAAIASATDCLVGIPVGRLETVRLAGLPEHLFTTDMSATHIRALPKWMVTVKFLAKLNRTKATLGIIPTGFACLSNEPRPPAPSLSASPLSDCQPQQAMPPAAALSKTAAVLADTNSLQQQQVWYDGQQDAGSDEGLQQQQLQASQQCWGQQHLGNVPGQQQQLECLYLQQQQQSVGQTDAHTSTVQQQQEGEQCFGADTCIGPTLLQQAQSGDEEEVRLFSCAGKMEEDLDAYATLVHGAQCREREVSAAEIEATLPLLKKVPYSLHSSYRELESFVTHLRPQALVPIVKKSYDSKFPIDPNRHFKHLLGCPHPPGHPPGPSHVQREKRRKGCAVRQEVTDADKPHKLSWQGLLHDCTKAIKQMKQHAKPDQLTACSLSTCPRPESEPDCKLVTCPTIKAEVQGTHESLLVRPEGRGPLSLLGSLTNGLSAEAKPAGGLMNCFPKKAVLSDNTLGHSFTATQVQQNAAVTEELSQLPQQGVHMPMQEAQQGAQPPLQQAQPRAVYGSVLGRSMQTEAEQGVDHGQAGVRMGLQHQRPAEALHETAAVKRRCMPNWGKSNQAQAGLVSSANCAVVHQNKETEMGLLSLVPAMVEAGRRSQHVQQQEAVEEAVEIVIQETQDLCSSSKTGQQQPAPSLVQCHSNMHTPQLE